MNDEIRAAIRLLQALERQRVELMLALDASENATQRRNLEVRIAETKYYTELMWQTVEYAISEHKPFSGTDNSALLKADLEPSWDELGISSGRELLLRQKLLTEHVRQTITVLGPSDILPPLPPSGGR